MIQNRLLSSNYSSLIDVLRLAHYNKDMVENAVVTLIDIETAEPKHRITRSAGAVYAALIVLMIGCISLGNLLYARWQIPRYVTQPGLYALLALGGCYLYRRHHLCYRYTLTDKMLAIEQIGGRSEKTLAAILLSDISAIQADVGGGSAAGHIVRAALPPRNLQTRITARYGARQRAYVISASEAFVARLSVQWQVCNAERAIDTTHG